MGRPKKEIDWDMVKSLAEIQCTGVEIAACMGIAHRTLTGREEFSQIYKSGLEVGKKSLRRVQWNHAQKSPTMAIWLGKQWLGQSDHQTIENDSLPKEIKIEIVESI